MQKNQIKQEINKLLKLLDNIRVSHEQFINYEINKLINEVVGINNDLTLTDSTDYFSDIFKYFITSRRNKNLYQFLKDSFNQYNIILDVVINLNKLLDKPIKRVLTLEEIKQKEMLTIKDVELIYGYSKFAQKGYRSRIRHPLAHHKPSRRSKSANTKVYYKKKELEDWINNFL